MSSYFYEENPIGASKALSILQMKPNGGSSSSSRAISTDIPDPLSPPLPIVHRFRQVLMVTPRILI